VLTQAPVRDKKWGQPTAHDREIAVLHLETEMCLIRQDKD